MMEDFLGNLPTELINEIFSYLSSDELIVASHVNRKWRNIVMNNDYLWKNICKLNDVLDYIPPNPCETPFNEFCNLARKYLIYEKTLLSNWAAGKNHVLDRISAATAENITFWKRIFVRTYIEGNAVDVFKVDCQCNVNRVQRIITRYICEGRDDVTINDTWLTITRLNTTSVYKIQPNGEYKLTWIFTVICQDSLPIEYIHVNNETSVEDIDKFLKKYQDNNCIIQCKCVLKNKYIWLMVKMVNIAIVIIINEDNGTAEVIQRFVEVSPESFCFDKVGVATYIQSGIGLFRANGENIYSYKLPIWRKGNILAQNQSTVAFLQDEVKSNVVLINRKTNNVVTIEEAKAALFCLHPIKPIVFVLSTEINCDPTKPRSYHDFPLKLRSYSTVNGDLIWSVNESLMWSIEKWFKITVRCIWGDVPALTIIHNKYLLLGRQMHLLLSCSTGEQISITNEENAPLQISDVFKVCRFSAHNYFIGVKCYLC